MRAPLAFFALALFAASPLAAAPSFASETAPAAASTADESEFEQRALTVKQIEGLIASHDVIAAILDKVPEDKRDEPNAEVQAALDKAARGFSFKDYGDLDNVAGNVEFLLAGFDREKKTFIGLAAVVEQEIAAIQADASLRPKQKEHRIKKLRDALVDAPQVRFASNIPLVTKFYDKLVGLFDDGEE